MPQTGLPAIYREIEVGSPIAADRKEEIRRIIEREIRNATIWAELAAQMTRTQWRAAQYNARAQRAKFYLSKLGEP